MRTKEVNGITLITLVITITILLILSAVTINAIVGDNGIIKQAKLTSDRTSEKAAKEEIKSIMNEYSLSDKSQSLEDFFKDKIPDRIDYVINNRDGTITVSKDGYTVTMENVDKEDEGKKQDPTITVGTPKVVANSDGTGNALSAESVSLGNTLYIFFIHSIDGGTTTVSPNIPYAVTENGTYNFTVTGTVGENTYTKTVTVKVNQFKDTVIDKIKIGDYVDYTYDSTGSYSLASTYSGYSSNQIIGQTTGLKWRILNIDETAQTVDLISDGTTGTSVYFQGVLGYNNGPYLMNKICEAQYSNSSKNIKARNINLLDMEKHLTPTGISTRNSYLYDGNSSNYAQYGTTKTYSSSTNYPSLYKNQIGAGVDVAQENASSIVQPDKSKGNDPYQESKAIASTEPTTDSTAGSGSPLTITQTLYSISINSTNYGEGASVLTAGNTFWIAARSIDTSAQYADFGLRCADYNIAAYDMYRSYGSSYTATSRRLRPVVSLNINLFTGGKDSSGAWEIE